MGFTDCELSCFQSHLGFQEKKFKSSHSQKLQKQGFHNVMSPRCTYIFSSFIQKLLR